MDTNARFVADGSWKMQRGPNPHIIRYIAQAVGNKSNVQ